MQCGLNKYTIQKKNTNFHCILYLTRKFSDSHKNCRKYTRKIIYSSNLTSWYSQRNILSSRLLRTRSNFSRSLILSVGMLALGWKAIHFIDPGVKVNGRYYREVLLKRDLFTDIRKFSDYYIFQQDSARLTEIARGLSCFQRKLRASSHRLCGLQTVLTLIQLTMKSGV